MRWPGPHKLTRRVFELNDAAEIERNLEGIRILLNCAGPFSRTCEPLLEGCLRNRIHYLDITGEIDVFALCHHTHKRAEHEGVVVFPGTGFDVVPTDCLAAMLKQRLPDATHLVLAFEAGGGPSPGTARTSVEGLASGGRARIDGEVVEVPLAWKSREFVREDGSRRSAMTIPWGDVYTAFVSTGIANIETYMAMPEKTIARARWLRHVRWLLGTAPVQKFLQDKAGQTSGPDQAAARNNGLSGLGRSAQRRRTPAVAIAEDAEWLCADGHREPRHRRIPARKFTGRRLLHAIPADGCRLRARACPACDCSANQRWSRTAATSRSPASAWRRRRAQSRMRRKTDHGRLRTSSATRPHQRGW